MKRLLIDIETAPNIGFFWQTGYKLTIDYENIIKERAIICISYKWEGSRKVEHLSWDKNQDDRKMIQEFAGILEKADEVVAHNGDQFDLKWIRGRALKFGIDLSFPITTHDTLKIARQKFRLNSNRLDYIAKFLGVGSKIDTGGFNLWKKIVLDKDKKSLKKMLKYCDNDVRILELVWEKLKPYAPHKISVSENRVKCPECGGQLNKHKEVIKASGTRVMQLKCKQCGKYHSIPLKTFEKYASRK